MMAGFPFTGSAQPLSSGVKDYSDYAAIDQYIEEQMKDCRIPGLSLGIVKGGQVLYLRGYGSANEAKHPVTPQTPFIIASVSKTLTALALMQLEEDGKVDLDSPVSHYLPDFETVYPIYEEMTIRQVLNHTAGFDPQIEWRAASPKDSDESIADLVQKFGSFPLAYSPGTRFEYSNAGYIVLGEVIGQVSGLSYEAYMQQNIFDPLEMRHSFTSMDQAAKDGPAVGYRTLFGFPRVSGLEYREGHLPAAGILSSSEDLTHYMIMLLNGGIYEDTRVLSEESVAEMLTPSSSISGYIDYGLGWYVTSGSFYHGGELADYQAKIKVMPEDELGVVLLYNTSSSTAVTLFGVGYREKIETGIINILYGVSPTDQPGQGPLNLNSYPMTITYSLMVGLPVLAALLLILSACRLRLIPGRLAQSRLHFGRILTFSILSHILLPLYILFAVPRIGVSWAYVLHYIPDAGWFALILSVLLLVIGIYKSVLIAMFLRSRHHPQNLTMTDVA
jgi:CubicO group peptidase (beta-lactamase class C family)